MTEQDPLLLTAQRIRCRQDEIDDRYNHITREFLEDFNYSKDLVDRWRSARLNTPPDSRWKIFLSRTKKLATTTGELVESSRMSRLENETINDQRPVLQKMLRTTAGRIIIVPALHAIPISGDLTTIVSALAGEDLLTGDKLDKVDRIIYTGVSLAPFIPTLPGIIIANLLRKNVEDLIHGIKISDPKLITSSLYRLGKVASKNKKI